MATNTSECRKVSCCGDANLVQFSDLQYSLVSGASYSNSEFTLTVQCPVGYDCTAPDVTVVLPPGVIVVTPPIINTDNPPCSGCDDPFPPSPGSYTYSCGGASITITTDGTGFTQAQIDQLVNFFATCQATQDANVILQPVPVVTPAGSPGLRLWNTEQTCTVECPEGSTGDPVTVTVPANTLNVIVAQSATPLAKYLAQQQINTDAYNQACDEATAALDCTTPVVCPQFLADYSTPFALPVASSAVYVEATDRIWVGAQTNGIYVIDPADGTVEANPVPGSTAEMVAVASAGRVFARDLVAVAFQAYNEATFALEGSIVPAPGISSLLPVQDTTNNYVYIQNGATNGEVLVYDATTLALVSTTTVLDASAWGCPAYHPASNRLYVGVEDVGVQIFNPLTGALTGTIAYAVGNFFYGAVYSPEADRIVIGVYDGVNDQIHFINPNTNTVADTLIISGGLVSQNFSMFRSPQTGAIIAGSAAIVIDPVLVSVVCELVSIALSGGNIGFAASNETVWFPAPADNETKVYTQ